MRPIEQTSSMLLSYYSPFSENQGLNIQLENENDIRPMSYVFLTKIFFNLCEQTNVYANQVISAVPQPFTKNSIMQTIKVPELKIKSI